jgi:hypothetical protein
MAQPLDPHEESKDSKPVRRAVCYRIPKSLKQLEDNEDRSSLNVKNEYKSYFKEKLLKTNVFSAASMRDWPHNKSNIPMTGILLSTFVNIGREVTKSNRIKSNEDLDPEDIEDDFIYRDPVDDHEYEQALNKSRIDRAASSSSVADKQPQYENMGSNNHNDYWNDNNDNGYDMEIDIPDNGQEIGSAAEDDVPLMDDDEDAQLAKRVDKILNDELESTLTSSYKMICDKMIMDFKRGLEKYAKESQLSRRVADWTIRIEPILLAQEKAPSYDIHQYSDKILVQMNKVISKRQKQINKKNKESIKFDDIVAGNVSSAEVCRVFLACLQLANYGNVLVIPPIKQSSNTKSLNIDSFSLELLDTAKKIDIENDFPVGQYNS